MPSNKTVQTGTFWKMIMLLILFMMPTVLLFTLSTLFAQPRVARREIRGWKKTGGVEGIADKFSLSWLARQAITRSFSWPMLPPWWQPQHNQNIAITEP